MPWAFRRSRNRPTGWLECPIVKTWLGIAEFMPMLTRAWLLGPRPIKHARESDGFADVLQAAHPGDETLDAHAESGVRNRAVAAEIEIPIEGFGRQIMVLQALQQQIEIVDALASLLTSGDMPNCYR